MGILVCERTLVVKFGRLAWEYTLVPNLSTLYWECPLVVNLGKLAWKGTLVAILGKIVHEHFRVADLGILVSAPWQIDPGLHPLVPNFSRLVLDDSLSAPGCQFGADWPGSAPWWSIWAE